MTSYSNSALSKLTVWMNESLNQASVEDLANKKGPLFALHVPEFGRDEVMVVGIVPRSDAGVKNWTQGKNVDEILRDMTGEELQSQYEVVTQFQPIKDIQGSGENPGRFNIDTAGRFGGHPTTMRKVVIQGQREYYLDQGNDGLQNMLMRLANLNTYLTQKEVRDTVRRSIVESYLLDEQALMQKKWADAISSVKNTSKGALAGKLDMLRDLNDTDALAPSKVKVEYNIIDSLNEKRYGPLGKDGANDLINKLLNSYPAGRRGKEVMTEHLNEIADKLNNASSYDEAKKLVKGRIRYMSDILATVPQDGAMKPVVEALTAMEGRKGTTKVSHDIQEAVKRINRNLEQKAFQENEEPPTGRTELEKMIHDMKQEVLEQPDGPAEMDRAYSDLVISHAGESPKDPKSVSRVLHLQATGRYFRDSLGEGEGIALDLNKTLTGPKSAEIEGQEMNLDLATREFRLDRGGRNKPTSGQGPSQFMRLMDNVRPERTRFGGFDIEGMVQKNRGEIGFVYDVSYTQRKRSQNIQDIQLKTQTYLMDPDDQTTKRYLKSEFNKMLNQYALHIQEPNKYQGEAIEDVLGKVLQLDDRPEELAGFAARYANASRQEREAMQEEAIDRYKNFLAGYQQDLEASKRDIDVQRVSLSKIRNQVGSILQDEELQMFAQNVDHEVRAFQAVEEAHRELVKMDKGDTLHIGREARQNLAEFMWIGFTAAEKQNKELASYNLDNLMEFADIQLSDPNLRHSGAVDAEIMMEFMAKFQEQYADPSQGIDSMERFWIDEQSDVMSTVLDDAVYTLRPEDTKDGNLSHIYALTARDINETDLSQAGLQLEDAGIRGRRSLGPIEKELETDAGLQGPDPERLFSKATAVKITQGEEKDVLMLEDLDGKVVRATLDPQNRGKHQTLSEAAVSLVTGGDRFDLKPDRLRQYVQRTTDSIRRDIEGALTGDFRVSSQENVKRLQSTKENISVILDMMRKEDENLANVLKIMENMDKAEGVQAERQIRQLFEEGKKLLGSAQAMQGQGNLSTYLGLVDYTRKRTEQIHLTQQLADIGEFMNMAVADPDLPERARADVYNLLRKKMKEKGGLARKEVDPSDPEYMLGASKIELNVPEKTGRGGPIHRKPTTTISVGQGGNITYQQMKHLRRQDGQAFQMISEQLSERMGEVSTFKEYLGSYRNKPGNMEGEAFDGMTIDEILANKERKSAVRNELWDAKRDYLQDEVMRGFERRGPDEIVEDFGDRLVKFELNEKKALEAASEAILSDDMRRLSGTHNLTRIQDVRARLEGQGIRQEDVVNERAANIFASHSFNRSPGVLAGIAESDAIHPDIRRASYAALEQKIGGFPKIPTRKPKSSMLGIAGGAAAGMFAAFGLSPPDTRDMHEIVREARKKPEDIITEKDKEEEFEPIVIKPKSGMKISIEGRMDKVVDGGMGEAIASKLQEILPHDFNDYRINDDSRAMGRDEIASALGIPERDVIMGQ